MFEFQTAISELTGLPVANASLYEGPSSVASAAYLALGAAKGRERLVVSRGLHPHARETLRTYARGFDAEVVEVAARRRAHRSWTGSPARSTTETAAVFVQNPNFLGAIEDLEALAAVAHDAGALCVAAVDPITLGMLRPPGECGVDIAVGEGQPLGNRLDFGGPSFGFFAAGEEHLRRMPGRIAGETADVDGRRGFVLALQTREQHIRREKATHNICTSQALNALAGTVYLRLARAPWDRRARRAPGPADGLRPRAADGDRRGRAAPRRPGRCASSRSASTPPWPRSSTASARRGSPPATRSPATTPSSRTGSWWRSPNGALEGASTASPTHSAGRSRAREAPHYRMSVAKRHSPRRRRRDAPLHPYPAPSRDG